VKFGLLVENGPQEIVEEKHCIILQGSRMRGNDFCAPASFISDKRLFLLAAENKAAGKINIGITCRLFDWFSRQTGARHANFNQTEPLQCYMN
jgi:hypothetical protein